MNIGKYLTVEFLKKCEEELKEFKNLTSDEKFRILKERNQEKAE